MENNFQGIHALKNVALQTSFELLLKKKYLTFNHVDGEDNDFVVLDAGYVREKEDKQDVFTDKVQLSDFLKNCGIEEMHPDEQSKVRHDSASTTHMVGVKVKYYRYKDLLKLLELMGLKDQKEEVIDTHGPSYAPIIQKEQ